MVGSMQQRKVLLIYGYVENCMDVFECEIRMKVVVACYCLSYSRYAINYRDPFVCRRQPKTPVTCTRNIVENLNCH